MSDINDPRGQYDRYRAGEPGGRFETDARTYVAPLQTIVNVIDYGETIVDPPLEADVVVDVSKPDARLSVELFIGHVLRDEDINGELDTVTGNGQTVAQNLADARLWLSLLCDFGGGLREAENIIGTRAVPVTFVAPGLWGATYECDLDVVVVRATLKLFSAGLFGRWMAGARWTALEPMSQRDWEHARQNMHLVITPGHAPALQVMRDLV